jgi:hypothetical protein
MHRWTSAALAILAAAASSDWVSAADAVPKARVFAPGVISGPDPDIAPAFDPSHRRMFFSRRLMDRFTIMESRQQGLAWSMPRIAPFSGRWNDLEAAIAPDGRYLIFASNRPVRGEHSALTTRYQGKEQDGGRLWRVGLSPERGGEPEELPASVNEGASVWTPSIAANDDLFFMRTDPKTGRFRLMVARARGGGAYRPAQALAFSTGAFNDVDPAIDPKRRFLIFSSDRGAPEQGVTPGPERLFIAFAPTSAHPLVCRMEVPGWIDPAESEVESRLSPRQKLLYFASRHPDHAPGQSAAGPWDNGKANIWTIALQPSLWQGSGGACVNARV